MENIIREYYEKHFKFWGEFFDNKKELEDFIYGKVQCVDNIPKIMINNVQRLCDLSNEMDKIRPGRKDLNVFFIVTCIESIFTLSNKGIQKQQMIIDFYENYIEEEDKKLIQDNILILNRVDEFSCLKNITIEQFALLLISIRNTVAHEGIYWNLSFKGELEGDPNMVNVIKSKLKKDQGYEVITYDIGLKYTEFIRITIKGFISFINDYFEKNCL